MMKYAAVAATLLALFVAMLLTGCAPNAAPVAGPSPRAAVLALALSLTEADNLAYDYAALPRCTAQGPQFCSRADLVQQIKAAASKARTAVQSAMVQADAAPAGTSAEAITADAAAAVAAFQAIIPPPATGAAS
jgi:hypothetical protein